MTTSIGIAQTDTTSKVCISRWHVISLIKDVEQGEMYKAELDTLAAMYFDLHKKSTLQDSVIAMQKDNLRICQDGWQDCESIVAMQKQDMEDYKAKQKTIKNIGKGIILALAAALILK